MAKEEADSKVKLEFVKYIATHIQSQILLADRKAAWIFSVLAVATGALLTKISKIEWSQVNSTNTMILIIIPLFFTILAFIQVSRVIYPRLSSGNKNGLSYFEDIIQNKKNQYVYKGLNLSEREMFESLYQESYDLAGIASKKFKTLLYGVILTTMSLILTIIILLTI